MKRKRIDLAQLINDIIFNDDEKENPIVVEPSCKKRRRLNKSAKLDSNDSNNNSPVCVFREVFTFNESKQESTVDFNQTGK